MTATPDAWSPQPQHSLALEIYGALRTTGRLHEHRVLTYRCTRACL